MPKITTIPINKSHFERDFPGFKDTKKVKKADVVKKLEAFQQKSEGSDANAVTRKEAGKALLDYLKGIKKVFPPEHAESLKTVIALVEKYHNTWKKLTEPIEGIKEAALAAKGKYPKKGSDKNAYESFYANFFRAITPLQWFKKANMFLKKAGYEEIYSPGEMFIKFNKQEMKIKAKLEAGGEFDEDEIRSMFSTGFEHIGIKV